MSYNNIFYNNISYKIINSNKSNNFILDLETGTNDITNNLNVFLSSIQQVVANSLKNEKETKLMFHASKVLTLADVLKNQSLTYEECIIMVGCLSAQLMYLNERNITIMGFDLDDILVLNNLTTFFIASPQHLKNVFNKKIEFDLPFYKPMFVSPLLEAVESIPSCVPCFIDRCSLAMIIIHAFGICDLDLNLDSIINTKLYWFLKRCLNHYDGRMILI